ncbi:MAG: BolA family transcriptional regulator [Hirschia sp.]|nr:BolA family transcriptional regulator [Hirschia sp.]MBF19672.1 BolA family transcriptional regulator [Hirschia sp.]|tara:strand:- start:221 stop:463 length:243 start_codon:yes stop_codon:yes gene_type:complete
MAMSHDDLMSHLREGFPDAEIVLTDLVGDNNHWQAEIVDESFRGKPRVAQHKMVYASLKGAMDGADGELHALALKTRAPA